MIGPVNSNLIAAPATSKERRSAALVQRLTGFDADHALEFVRLFEWQIRTSPGGAEGFLRRRRT